MRQVGELLTKTLLDFGVTGKIIGYQPGPVVTVYEFQPDAGIKQSKIIGLIDDIALSLKVDSILIQPVKGKEHWEYKFLTRIGKSYSLGM